MYVATGGLNLKWGAPIANGRAGHHWPPAGDGPAYRCILKHLYAHIYACFSFAEQQLTNSYCRTTIHVGLSIFLSFL